MSNSTRRWQGIGKVHCVIEHISPPASSPLKPLASLALRTSTTRHLSTTYNKCQTHISVTKTPVLRNKSFLSTYRKIPSYTRPPTSIISRAMSDDAYASFLDKANADLDSGRSQETTQKSSSTRTETFVVNVKVPTPLTSVDAYYISDADEPFEPVALKWEGAEKGKWPDASQFSKLISADKDLSSSIETLSTSSFDPKNQYASVVKSVRAAAAQGSDGDESAVEVKVYRVEVGTSRVEYYVTALNAPEGLLVGLRAKAIES
ncbi:hypothetical protein BJX70DRAFT_92334 [Aspergillus crustosus]